MNLKNFIYIIKPNKRENKTKQKLPKRELNFAPIAFFFGRKENILEK